MEIIIPVEPITITVNGTMNSGKSTIAHLITETLRNAGLDVFLKDEPLVNGWSSRSSDRVEWLKKRGLILNVVTEQRLRSK